MDSEDWNPMDPPSAHVPSLPILSQEIQQWGEQGLMQKVAEERFNKPLLLQSLDIIAPHRRGRKAKKTEEVERLRRCRTLRRYKRKWKIERSFACSSITEDESPDMNKEENYKAFILLGCMLLEAKS